MSRSTFSAISIEESCSNCFSRKEDISLVRVRYFGGCLLYQGLLAADVEIGLELVKSLEPVAVRLDEVEEHGRSADQVLVVDLGHLEVGEVRDARGAIADELDVEAGGLGGGDPNGLWPAERPKIGQPTAENRAAL